MEVGGEHRGGGLTRVWMAGRVWLATLRLCTGCLGWSPSLRECGAGPRVPGMPRVDVAAGGRCDDAAVARCIGQGCGESRCAGLVGRAGGRMACKVVRRVEVA